MRGRDLLSAIYLSTFYIMYMCVISILGKIGDVRHWPNYLHNAQIIVEISNTHFQCFQHGVCLVIRQLISCGCGLRFISKVNRVF